ncbi:hypothetical protein GBA52_024918 [Prunus armeniaca]|nr:hypothetical protein GBA52_024918 [Prunus armeniaca]
MFSDRFLTELWPAVSPSSGHQSGLVSALVLVYPCNRGFSRRGYNAYESGHNGRIRAVTPILQISSQYNCTVLS